MSNIEMDGGPHESHLEFFNLYCKFHPGHKWMGPMSAPALLLHQESKTLSSGSEESKVTVLGQAVFLSETLDATERLVCRMNEETKRPQCIRLPAHLVVVPPAMEMFLLKYRNELLAKKNEELQKKFEKLQSYFAYAFYLTMTAVALNLCTSGEIITMFVRQFAGNTAAVKPKDGPELLKELLPQIEQKIEQMPAHMKKAVDALQKLKTDTGPHDQLIEP